MRSEESIRKGKPYGIGDEVRIKLSVSERGRLGGKKIAPLYSDVYIVTGVTRGMWTYNLEPANGT